MKKLLASLSLMIYFLIPAISFARPKPDGTTGTTPVGICPPDEPYKSLCNISTGNFGAVVGPLIQLIFVIAIIVALLYLVWGGFKWLTSGGDKSAVAAAREHIVAALVGLVIIFLAYFILSILLAFFVPGVNFTNLQIPHIGPVSGAGAASGTCRGGHGGVGCLP